MGIDLKKGYRKLLNHIGHDVEIAIYGDLEEPHDVAIECMTCGCVLIDYDPEQLRAEIITRDNTIRETKQELSIQLERNEKLENENRREKLEWKKRFISRVCKFYPALIEQAFRGIYLRETGLRSGYPSSINQELIKELDAYYAVLYQLNEEHDPRQTLETIVSEFGEKILLTILETIRGDTKSEVILLEHALLKQLRWGHIS